MKKYGWPVSNSSELILNHGERFNDGIMYRSEEFRTEALIGTNIQIGQHIVYILQGLGYPRSDSYAIVLYVAPTYVKALWQDGSIQIWMRSDWKLYNRQYTYSIGDPVWYDLYPSGENKKRGIVKGLSGVISDETEVFEIEDEETKALLTYPKTNVILRAALPGPNISVDAQGNAVKVVT